ncbi:MAG: STAS domain-containing protein [Novosphingobium sp.]
MSDGELRWQSEPAPGGLIVAPFGRVDEGTASAFADGLAAAVEQASAAGAGRLAVDLAGIDYMSSRGLRALTLAQRKGTELKVTVVLTRPNAMMREILAISRYDKVFRVHERNEDALAD